MKWIMKNRGDVMLVVMVVVLGVVFGLLVHGLYYPAEAVIGGMGNLLTSGHPHNLSNDPGGERATTETQICIFCHTPHNAITEPSLINAPLWNHRLSTKSYTVKTKDTIFTNSRSGITSNLLSSPPSTPDGTSRLCLSCHDGSVAIGDIQSGPQITMESTSCINAAGRLTSACAAYIGTDLANKHVVSIPMNDALISASAANCGISGISHKVTYPWSGAAPQTDIVILRPTATTFSGPGVSTPQAPVGKYKAGYNYGVQCSTCHDPHLWTSGADLNVPGTKLLVTGFNNLCQACHDPC